MTTLSLLSSHLPKDCRNLLEGAKESKWITILQKADKKKKEKGVRVSKLLKAIVCKTADWQKNSKLEKLTDRAVTYLHLHSSKLTKKAKKRYKEVSKKIVSNSKEKVKSSTAEKTAKKAKETATSKKPVKETRKIVPITPPPLSSASASSKPVQAGPIVQTSKLLKLPQVLHVLIAQFVVDFGNDKFFNKENNVSFFRTCKDLRESISPFLERKGKDLAVGDILRKVLQHDHRVKLPAKAIFQPLGKEVKSLDLTQVFSPDAADSTLAQRIVECFPNLTNLILSGSRKLSPLTSLKGLDSLSISQAQFSPDESGVSKIQSLTSLSLINCANLSEQTLEEIGSKLNDLVHLNINGTRGIAGSSLRHVANLQNLKTFRAAQLTLLDGPFGFGAAILQEIAKLQALTHLDLSDNQIIEAAIPTLAPLKRLERLDLNSALFFTAQSLANLSVALPQITYLGLKEYTVQNAGLNHLQRFTRLESLDLENSYLNDIGIGHIIPITTLTYLNLSGKQSFTNQGLELLTPLKKLKELVITRQRGIVLDHVIVVPQVPEDDTLKSLKEKMKGLTVTITNAL
jgi:hypothetical protein